MKKGFTLAEVLITLGVIGIVAAMTLPSLIGKWQEKATVSRLKVTYSILSNAYLRAINENPDLSSWFTGSSRQANEKIFIDNIKPYLNIIKDCGFSTGCITSGKCKTLSGSEISDYNNLKDEYRFSLSNGTQVWVWIQNGACNTNGYCGNIKVDIDGFKGEYTYGKDVFLFDITTNGIVPKGRPTDGHSMEKSCNRSITSQSNGNGCTAWVILNENMDYLHCDDLSWNGKHKCK